MSRWMAAVTPQLPSCRQGGTHDLLDLRDEVRGDQQVLPAPVLLQHDLEPVEIAERLVHVGLVDLDIAELDGGVALDDAVGGRLAHDLRIDDGVLRHVDDEVAVDGGRAGEAAAVGQAAHALVALFLRPLGRDVVERRRRSCAWRNCLPAPRSGSARRWRARRRRSRHRRRANAPRRASACRRESARACPTA